MIAAQVVQFVGSRREEIGKDGGCGEPGEYQQ